MNALLLAAAFSLYTGAARSEPPDARRSGAAETAAATPTGAAAAAIRTIDFSGHRWTVKNSGAALWGPGPNVFSDAAANVWVDTQGRLHLAITNDNGVWKSAEVISQTSFGYGTYRFTLETDVAGLDPNVVLGLFTWNDNAAFYHREIDIEFARWGNRLDTTNAQYTVQPYTQAGNELRWALPTGYVNSTHSFVWSSRSVVFNSSSAGNPLQRWSFTRRAGVPRAGGENARMNLWLFQGAAPQNGVPAEVIVSKFEFLP